MSCRNRGVDGREEGETGSAGGGVLHVGTVENRFAISSRGAGGLRRGYVWDTFRGRAASVGGELRAMAGGRSRPKPKMSAAEANVACGDECCWWCPRDEALILENDAGDWRGDIPPPLFPPGAGPKILDGFKKKYALIAFAFVVPGWDDGGEDDGELSARTDPPPTKEEAMREIRLSFSFRDDLRECRELRASERELVELRGCFCAPLPPLLPL